MDLVLDLADKLGSVLSAVFGGLGLVLTALGLWLPGWQFRRSLRRLDDTDDDDIDDASTPPTGLQIPDRAEWVPDSHHLPSHPPGIRLPQGGNQPRFDPNQPRDSTAWRGSQQPQQRGWAPSRRLLLPAGLALLALAVLTLMF